MTSRGKYTKTLLMTSVIAASLIAAPQAGATATCQDAGAITRCETNGSVSIKAVPTTRAPHVADTIPRNNNRSRIALSW